MHEDEEVVLILKSGLFQTNLSISHFKHHHSYLRVDTAMKT